MTVTLNGVNYSGNVQADGSWSVSVPTGDLASLTASSYTVNASVSDKARNSASATHNLTVDLAAPVVTINTVAGDDIINATNTDRRRSSAARQRARLPVIRFP